MSPSQLTDFCLTLKSNFEAIEYHGYKHFYLNEIEMAGAIAA